MKQKITIKVVMDCDKCRNKALKIAAQVRGVSSVAIEGTDKDRVVVIGEDVDTVCLGKLLKKKFSHVTVLTVEEVKPPKPPPPPKKDGKDKDPKDKGPKGKDGKKEKPICSCKVCEKEKDKGKGCNTLWIVPTNPCSKCQSRECGGACKPCSKCRSPQCGGACKPCAKCESHKCCGDCKACSKCQSYKCGGQCSQNPCPSLPWRCYGQCPPWYPCPTCYVKCPPPPPPPCPLPCDPCSTYGRVVYDPYPDNSCSIQ